MCNSSSSTNFESVGKYALQQRNAIGIDVTHNKYDANRQVEISKGKNVLLHVKEPHTALKKNLSALSKSKLRNNANLTLSDERTDITYHYNNETVQYQNRNNNLIQCTTSDNFKSSSLDLVQNVSQETSLNAVTQLTYQALLEKASTDVENRNLNSLYDPGVAALHSKKQTIRQLYPAVSIHIHVHVVSCKNTDSVLGK